MPTTKNRSTKTKSSSSTRQSRANETKAKTTPVNKKPANTEMSGSNGHSQLEKLFFDSLKDIYWAEKHLTKVLPKMKKKATSDDLKEAIEEHIHMPSGSFKPILIAFGLTITAYAAIYAIWLMPLGIVISLIGIVLWNWEKP